MSSRESSTRRRPVGVVTLLVLVAFLAGPSPGESPISSAWAQNKQDGCLKDTVCKDYYDQALKLYDAGKYADALPKFEDAYTRRQMPWLLLNIGRTLQRLGRAQQAITYYERYKKSELNLDPATLERVNKYIEQSKALLEKPPEDQPIEQRPLRLDPTQTTTAQNTPPLTPTDPAVSRDESGKKPVYKKWWFWTIIGVVVVGGVAGGVAAGLAKKSPAIDPIQTGDPVLMPTF